MKKKKRSAAITLSLSFTLAVSLSSGVSAETVSSNGGDNNSKNGVFYEIYVNSFYDSNNDGHGDLKGITKKLDYINDGNPHNKKDLQVNGMWLMPIHPSPSYHKYDVTDYYSVAPEYGNLRDFKKLTKEAHKRGTKVIIDLVVNHTSSEHPWFKKAGTDKNSKYRDFYIWADDETDLNEKGPWGQQVWHKNPYGEGYYYGTFSSVMPDLNFDNPEVREEIIDVGKFWLKQGADGFRLDAALHVFEGETPEGAKKNIEWWNEFRDAMRETNPQTYLVGEVWEQPEVVAPYYQSLDSLFNFDLAGKIIDSVKNGADQGVADAASATDELFESYNPNKIDGIFLTNHDQNRVMSELNGNINKAKTAASILLTLPGNPFIYYGEEIGMTGKKPDELIREPFRWYEGDGEGQSSWETPVYNTGNNGISVEAQDKEKNSLLNHYRKMIRIRQLHEELIKGDLASIQVENSQVIAYSRSYEKESLQIYHNLSNKPVTITVPQKGKLIFSSEKGAKKVKSTLVIPANTTVIIK
ncbi:MULTISPECIES: alpha-amylase family glycosyl hydrolase [Bacillus]|uniref:Alpha-amylase n=2 Tax=Bacillus TaxID=1386 RepID=A0A0M3R8U9_9BACI|nr:MULTISPECIES: alpha-amylase family glycosyl hydrolase [Bacillus]ALC80312.1 alpha-amylase [Bacillus gobiensis]MBP1083852.1 glycosidase [Bacillus capparidis]MED1098334.1 alpha-amylase family glycosyl hydrolase [Bacillus capparidis]